MHVVKVRNVEEALWKLLALLQKHGIKQTSRAGDVLVIPEPVTTVYERPWERVLFSPERDANPTFHLMEALWMLAGRDDLKFIGYFNRRMRNFSDDGETLHGAYGRRWRSWWDKDQLDEVVRLLRNHNNSRRAVIQMWDPRADLHTHEKLKDVCCNLCITAQLTGFPVKRLDLSIFCRSNDLIWGCTGTNSVHFSILQEYLAARIGVPIGKMYQISVNLHAYEPVFRNLESNLTISLKGHYKIGQVESDIIVEDGDSFDEELQEFFTNWNYADGLKRMDEQILWKNLFFPQIVLPMLHAYHLFRLSNDESRYDEMLNILDVKESPKSDWLRAAREWTGRRKAARAREKTND